jgi:integrase
VSPESRRDRVLSPDEIRTLWRELDSEHHRIATLFRTQLLTAQRPGEVSKMRWAQLNPALFERTADGIALPSKLEPIVWTIPGKETKNGLAHEVPLSSVVIELLRNLAKGDEDERLKINTLHEPRSTSPRERRASTCSHRARGRARFKEVQKAVQRLRKRCGFKFIAHHLRRTAATLMADAGVPENFIPIGAESRGARRHAPALQPARIPRREACRP